MKRIAVCPGSFDPVTVGHLDIITRASKLFDQVIVLVSKNIMKNNACFSPQERKDMILCVTKNLPNVTVDISEGLLADYVKDAGATGQSVTLSMNFRWHWQTESFTLAQKLFF